MLIHRHRVKIATIASLCLSGLLFVSARRPLAPPTTTATATSATLQAAARAPEARQRAQVGAPAPLPTVSSSIPEVEPVHDAVRRFAAGRSQAFFDEEAALDEVRRGGAGWLAVLRDDLQDVEPLESLPEDVQVQRHRPTVVLERMARIDILTDLAQTDPAARQALTEVAETPIDSGLPMHVKRALIAERYDILFKLVQLDRESAIGIFRAYPQAAQRVLKPALLTGLSEAHAAAPTIHQLLGD